MKFKSLVTALAAFAVGATFAIADEDTPLSKEMSAMNKSLRALKRQVADPTKKAENLDLIAKMKTSVANSLKLEPAKTKDQPDAEKAAYLEKYKAQMGDLDKVIDELKAAVDNGDAEAAQKVFDKLSDSKEKGHKDFAPDE
jgi:soluble cytochrome b562